MNDYCSMRYSLWSTRQGGGNDTGRIVPGEPANNDGNFRARLRCRAIK